MIKVRILDLLVPAASFFVAGIFFKNKQKCPNIDESVPMWYKEYSKYKRGVRIVKKKNVISLIKYYTEKIAKGFDASGDYQLAEYIMSLLSNVNTFVPQVSENVSPFFEKIEANTDMLLLPDEITNDLIGVVNAIEHHIGINKFLFQGAPGTGKTEAVKQLARIR